MRRAILSFLLQGVSMNKELLEALDTLRVKLMRSGIERTNGLLKAMGQDCSYYNKSLNVFLKRDYKEIKDMIELVNRLILENPIG
jgi:hypothetical protein